MVCLNENLTLLETSSSHLKMDDWKTTFGAPAHFQLPAVRFGEGPISKQGVIFTFDHWLWKSNPFKHTWNLSLLFHGKSRSFQQIQANFTFRNVWIPHFCSPFHKISKDFPNPQGLSLENPGEYPVNDLGSDKGGKTYDRYKWIYITIINGALWIWPTGVFFTL